MKINKLTKMNEIPNPFWCIKDGFFTYPESLAEIQSENGRQIAKTLSVIENGIQVFLRGSMLESSKPFCRSDVDLFVLYEDRRQLGLLSDALPGGFDFDIKIQLKKSIITDFVMHALLECRSFQVCGLLKQRIPIAADIAFAWEHWLKYCPAMIPNSIGTRTNGSLIYFKMLTRCFGVLSILRDRQFTRDITSCIKLATLESASAGDLLGAMRCSLEDCQDSTFEVSAIKKLLHSRFDFYFKTK